MRRIGLLTVLAVFVCPVHTVLAATFTENSTTPFGTFNEIDYVLHSGRFEGATSLGDFRVPYEIVAPANPAAGVRTLLVEPPHFAFGFVGRDIVLGREFLFARGLRYASVGFGKNGLNILDPLAEDLILAGSPVVPPAQIELGALVDEEIIVQFTEALTSDPLALGMLGTIDRRYAYGVSQTAAVLMETLLGPFAEGLFDATLLHIALWRPYFTPPGAFDFLPDGSPVPVPFTPPTGVGRVIFVESEGDQVVSDSELLRSAVGEPDYRIYETAGAAHQPTEANPLDHFMLMRAIFVRADEWVQWGIEPPASVLIAEDSSGSVDPVYGFPTGIARDADLNALGGVRLPQLEVGQAQYIASDFTVGFPITIPGLIGNSIDLACVPVEGGSGSRFESHGEYVSHYVAQVNALRNGGFLLDEDADFLKEQAASSTIGQPGTCP